jgi:glycosyltransferase involved in cell wall biosynthesis
MRMLAEPLVSIVMAVRNGQPFLPEAIESALAQTYRPIEVVVIDDGSGDRSLEIATSFGAPVRCVSTPPRGLAIARNTGIREARGDYFAFLDADDHWPLNRISAQLEAIESPPRADVVFGHEMRFPSKDARPLAARTGATMLVRREALARVGPFATEWEVGEFLDWLLRAEDLGLSMRMQPDVVIHRRVHDGNTTARRRGSYGDYVQILSRSLERRRRAAQDG